MKQLIFVLIYCASFFSSYPQNIPTASKGSIQFYTDYSCFRGNDSQTVTEIYLMVYADQLKYIKTGDISNGSYKVNALIEDSTGKIIKEQSWNTDAAQPGKDINIKNYVIYDQWRADLYPGKYKLLLKIEDANGPGNGSTSTKLDIPEFSGSNYQLSQIEFVNSFETSNETSVFSKGNQKVVPNPARRYGIFNPTLLMYYEIYNILQEIPGNLSITYSIYNKNDSLIQQYPEIKKTKNNSDAAIINGVDVSQLPTGIYSLKVKVNDLTSNRSVETGRYFEIVQADYADKNNLITQKQADDGANQIKYFATQNEMDMYNRLNLTGKAQFLIRFWKQKDPTPGTEKNEFLEEVQKRFHYANENFNTSTTQGWATDRGRVFIKYGKPDEIENHHFEVGTVPYEIWIYYKQKGYKFVFADLQYNGNYALIHSTKEGEVSNKDWPEYVKKM